VDKQQIRRFKTRLEARQHELRLSVEHRRQIARVAEPEPDAVDQASSVYEKESSLQRSNQEQALLRMIEVALSRIREGGFGECSTCGEEIEGKRRQAVPWAPNCLQCQEDLER
jgi:DnaK suppressor protein